MLRRHICLFLISDICHLHVISVLTLSAIVIEGELNWTAMTQPLYPPQLGSLRFNNATATTTSLGKLICVISVFIAISFRHLLCHM